MQRKLIGILSLLVCSFLYALPASAVSLPQCAPFPAETTDFVLVGEDNIIFELQSKGSGREINGNVLVVNPVVKNPGTSTGTGFIKVGSNTVINGTAIAKQLILPDAGAKITHCIADIIVANTPAAKASCGSGYPVVGTPFTDYATAHPACVEAPLGTLAFGSLCGTEPVVNTCANTAAPLTVAEGATLTLPPAPAPFPADATCFGTLTLGKGAVLNLGTGPWAFKTVKMLSGSRINGPVGSTAVNVNGEFATDPGVFITNIKLNVAAKTASEIVKIFNNSVLTNVVINAPFGKCHLHTGTDLQCSEGCCKVLDVEPITAQCEPGNPDFCTCPDGFEFNVDPDTTTPENKASRLCVQKAAP